MKSYLVRLPVSGVLEIEVEAQNEDEAIAKALESDATNDHITEWNTHRQIVQGNVFHGILNEAEAIE